MHKAVWTEGSGLSIESGQTAGSWEAALDI